MKRHCLFESIALLGSLFLCQGDESTNRVQSAVLLPRCRIEIQEVAEEHDRPVTWLQLSGKLINHTQSALHVEERSLVYALLRQRLWDSSGVKYFIQSPVEGIIDGEISFEFSGSTKLPALSTNSFTAKIRDAVHPFRIVNHDIFPQTHFEPYGRTLYYDLMTIVWSLEGDNGRKKEIILSGYGSYILKKDPDGAN